MEIDKNTVAEAAAVVAFGYALAKVSEQIPALNERKVLTRTILYTLGYYFATRRPAGGYHVLNMIEGK